MFAPQEACGLRDHNHVPLYRVCSEITHLIKYVWSQVINPPKPTYDLKLME